MSVHSLAAELAPMYGSPEALSKAVLAEVSATPETMHEALIEVLPHYVVAFITRKRNATISSRSAKVAGIRDWHARVLTEQMCTESGEWIAFGECAAADFDFAADVRTRRAAADMVRSNQFRRVAAAIREHGVAKAAELPEDVLRHAFDGAAS